MGSKGQLLRQRQVFTFCGFNCRRCLSCLLRGIYTLSPVSKKGCVQSQPPALCLSVYLLLGEMVSLNQINRRWLIMCKLITPVTSKMLH